VISYLDVVHLDEETRAEVDALLERSTAISQMPEDRDQIAAWEQLAIDCDRVGFPHLTTTARLSQYHLLSGGGDTDEAIAAFVRLMQVIRQHSDLIDPRKTEIVLGEIAMAAMTAVDDPSVPLERVEKMIELVDQEVRLQGTDRAGLHFARAVVACARGDAGETIEQLERYRAEGSEGWDPNSPGILQMDVPLVARFDPAAADEVLVRAARTVGIAVDGSGGEDGEDRATLSVLHAFLLRRQGRHDEAFRIADALLDSRSIDLLRQEAPPEQLIPVLENRPDAALAIVDHTLANVTFDGRDWEVIAALARDRVRADPGGVEGRLLRRLADEAAQRQDLRGATDVHSAELAGFWWEGLAPGQPPREEPAVDEAWADEESRAEEIIAAGWLKRAGWISFYDAPIALSERYVGLIHRSMELVSAADAAAADALAAEVRADAERLHCAATRVNAALFRSMFAAEHDDLDGMIDGFATAQREFAAVHDRVPDFVPPALEGMFGPAMQLMVGDPAASWQRIGEIFEAQERLVRDTGLLSAVSTNVARLEIIASLGRTDEVRELAVGIVEALGAEPGRVDDVKVLLSVVRLTAELAPDIAESMAEAAASAGDAEQRRSAEVWLRWFAVRGGDAAAAGAAAEDMLRTIEELGGDVSELGIVPERVVVDLIALAAGDPLPVLEALLAEAAPLTDDDFELFVSAAALLRDRAPADPRAAQFSERASRIARDRDGRDGGDRWARRLALRLSGAR